MVAGRATAPSMKAELVCVSTSQLWVTVCIQVSTSDIS